MKPGEESRIAGVIDAAVFYAVLGVIFLAAIPYGSVQLWWKAFFQCAIFAIAGLSLVGQLFRGETPRKIDRSYKSVLMPLMALIAFALIQTIPWSSTNLPGIGRTGRTLSADAFQTWLFTIHLIALVLIGWMLVIHTTTLHRLRVLVGVVISTGVLSALFGMWRHASQREMGFVLPYLRPALGYGQFINPNHFAFLMEMALGLTIGVVVGRVVLRKRLVYLLAAVPMWVALVLANSRGGVFSLICQVIFFALLLGSVYESSAESTEPENRWLRVSRMLAVRTILVAVLLIGTIATVSYVGGDRMARRLETVPSEFDYQPNEATTTRQAIWRATWEMIKDHPIAGVGFGGYAVAIPKYHRASGEVTPQEAHNDYLELLASGGLIALGLFIWFVVSLLRAARKRMNADGPSFEISHERSARLGALAGILTVGIHSLVDFGLHIPGNAFVFTALLAIVLVDVGERHA